MPTERTPGSGLEDVGVPVRPISGQIYLVEEKSGQAPWDDAAPPPDRSPLSGLINRH